MDETLNVSPQVSSEPSNLTPSTPTVPSAPSEPSNTVTAPSNDGASEPSTQETNWEERYKSSSTEAKRLAEQNKALEANLVNFASRDRGTFEAFLDHQKVGSTEREQLMTWYDDNYAKGETQPVASGKPNKSEPGVDTPARVAFDPLNKYRSAAVDELAEQKRMKDESRRMASDSFYSNPDNATIDDFTKTNINQLALYLDTKMGLEPESALAEAKRRILAPETYADEGYVRGIQDSMLGNTRISNGVSSGSAKVTNDYAGLRDKDVNFIKMELGRKNWKEGSDEAKSFIAKYKQRVNY